MQSLWRIPTAAVSYNRYLRLYDSFEQLGLGEPVSPRTGQELAGRSARVGRQLGVPAGPSRRQDCYIAETPSPSLLKTPTAGRWGVQQNDGVSPSALGGAAARLVRDRRPQVRLTVCNDPPPTAATCDG